jgi:hypothetical protein
MPILKFNFIPNEVKITLRVNKPVTTVKIPVIASNAVLNAVMNVPIVVAEVPVALSPNDPITFSSMKPLIMVKIIAVKYAMNVTNEYVVICFAPFNKLFEFTIFFNLWL